MAAKMVHVQKIKEPQEIVYNPCVLSMPYICSEEKKYIQLATDLQLKPIPKVQEEENWHLVGPLSFETIDKYNQTQQKFHIDRWIILNKQRNNLGTLPPTVGSNHSSKSKKIK